VLLRWCVQRGVPSIPKSRHRELIAENAQIFDLALSNETLLSSMRSIEPVTRSERSSADGGDGGILLSVG
jgi:diketogulonate reductase-like aldo/keto reductase